MRDDQAVVGRGDVQEARRAGVVGGLEVQALVDLVGQQPRAGRAAVVEQALLLGARQRPAGRVVRRVDDQHARARRDRGEQRVHVQRPGAVHRRQRHAAHRRAHDRRLRDQVGPDGRDDHDLVAGIDQRLRREHQAVDAARGDDDAAGVDRRVQRAGVAAPAPRAARAGPGSANRRSRRAPANRWRRAGSRSGVTSSLSPNQNASTSARPMPALAISRISEPWRRSMAWRMEAPVEATADCGARRAARRVPSGAEADEAQRARARDRVLARARLELGEQVLEVPLHRLVADVDGLGDLLVGVVARQQQQDAALLGRQRARALAALAIARRACAAPDAAPRRPPRRRPAPPRRRRRTSASG